MTASVSSRTGRGLLTWVLSERPFASSHGCNMPFWMKTRSASSQLFFQWITVSWRGIQSLCMKRYNAERAPFLRPDGVASTTASRSSFLVHTTTGPAGLSGTFSPLPTSTCSISSFIDKPIACCTHLFKPMQGPACMEASAVV